MEIKRNPSGICTNSCCTSAKGAEPWRSNNSRYSLREQICNHIVESGTRDRALSNPKLFFWKYTKIMNLHAYLPQDRLLAVESFNTLQDHTHGAAKNTYFAWRKGINMI